VALEEKESYEGEEEIILPFWRHFNSALTWWLWKRSSLEATVLLLPCHHHLCFIMALTQCLSRYKEANGTVPEKRKHWYFL